MSHKQPSICFVAPNAYNVLAGRDDLTHIGGAEVQQTLIARGLVECGHRVCFVVLDHGQPDGEMIDGMQVFRAYRPAAGVPGVRFFHPRLSGLWAALRRANTDVYYQRCAGAETGLVAMWCRRNGRRFVFGVAHDTNCDPALPALHTRRERLLYRYGLDRADRVIAQSLKQQDRLRRDFGIDAPVIRNCFVPLPASNDVPAGSGSEKRAGVLWAGRFSPVKRLNWCLDIAERMPDKPFVIAGTAGKTSEKAKVLLRRADALSNVVMCGYVPRQRMHALYRKAAVFLCTSTGEGFPNTFLEAWSCSTPVVSTVDPDDVIQRHGLGRACATREELCNALRVLEPSSPAWNECSARSVWYVNGYHGLETAVTRFSETLASLEEAIPSKARLEQSTC